MSNLPLFCPLVASALLRMGSIVTCRPAAVNSPWSCAMYRPASSATGTAPPVPSVFSRPDTFAGPLLGLPHPAPSTTDSPTVVTLIARRNLRLIIPLTTVRRRDARHERSGFRGRHGADADITSAGDDSGPHVAREANWHIRDLKGEYSGRRQDRPCYDMIAA